jgi:hypothetical protein
MGTRYKCLISKHPWWGKNPLLPQPQKPNMKVSTSPTNQQQKQIKTNKKK